MSDVDVTDPDAIDEALLEPWRYVAYAGIAAALGLAGLWLYRRNGGIAPLLLAGFGAFVAGRWVRCWRRHRRLRRKAAELERRVDRSEEVETEP